MKINGAVIAGVPGCDMPQGDGDGGYHDLAHIGDIAKKGRLARHCHPQHGRNHRPQRRYPAHRASYQPAPVVQNVPFSDNLLRRRRRSLKPLEKNKSGPKTLPEQVKTHGH